MSEFHFMCFFQSPGRFKPSSNSSPFVCVAICTHLRAGVTGSAAVGTALKMKASPH